MTVAIVVAIVVVIIIVVVGLMLGGRSRRRRALRQQFGPEYQRTVSDYGDERAAEQELRQRTQRREAMQIKPLDPAARNELSQRWRSAQQQFVDDPSQAVASADALIRQAMQQRGYPVGDFDQQANDLSVDHANVISEYRSAHEISVLNSRHEASTEQLREAMTQYRALFSQLLDHDGGERTDNRPADQPPR